MRTGRTALIALVCLAAATTAAHAIASVTVFGLKAPEEVGGFKLNDSINFERTKPGDGYGLDYSQPGWKLDVFIYDLKRNAIPDDAKSAIVRAEFERSREDVFLAQPRGLYAQVYLRRNFTVEDRGQAHALPVRGVSPDARRRQAAGRLSLRHLVEQQVHQVPHDHAERPRHRSDGAQAHGGLDSGAVERRQCQGRAGRGGAAAARTAAAPGGAAPRGGAPHPVPAGLYLPVAARLTFRSSPRKR